MATDWLRPDPVEEREMVEEAYGGQRLPDDFAVEVDRLLQEGRDGRHLPASERSSPCGYGLLTSSRI